MANTRHREQFIVTIVIVVGVLLLALFPWIAVLISDPLPPSLLAATPTAYSITLSFVKTATKRAEALQPSQVLVSGSTTVRIEIYLCPDDASETSSYVDAGAVFDILGWYAHPKGTIWFLIRDDKDKPQAWIKSSSNLTITPADFKPYSPKLTGCR